MMELVRVIHRKTRPYTEAVFSADNVTCPVQSV